MFGLLCWLSWWKITQIISPILTAEAHRWSSRRDPGCVTWRSTKARLMVSTWFTPPTLTPEICIAHTDPRNLCCTHSLTLGRSKMDGKTARFPTFLNHLMDRWACSRIFFCIFQVVAVALHYNSPNKVTTFDLYVYNYIYNIIIYIYIISSKSAHPQPFKSRSWTITKW